MNLRKQTLRYWHVLLLLLVMTAFPASISAETADMFAGDWTGTIEIPGQPLDVNVHLRWSEDELQGTMDIPVQGAFDLPLAAFSTVGPEISFALQGVPGDPKIVGTLDAEGAEIVGEFHQGGMAFPLTLQRKPAAAEPSAELQEQLDSIRSTIQELMAAWNVPGAAVGIVHRGDVLLAEGFGYADLEAEQPVDAETLFAIGSASKAFASASIALLVDEGRLAWDRPVVDYLPWFRMYTPELTWNATLRDFALHRSGLPRHDFAWYGRDAQRREFVEAMAHLEPAAGLREGFIYNNFGYTLLGFLAGETAAMSWEEFVQQRIFDPLDMSSSNFAIDQLQQADNHARPYDAEAGENVAIPYRNLDAMGPAGSINSNVTDMLAWVQMFLQSGTYNGTQVLSPMAVWEMTQPQVVIPTGGFTELNFSNYGLGWIVQDYRGDILVEHGGNIDGYSAMVAMVPRKQLGVVILTNQNGSALPTLALYYVLDVLSQREPVDWGARVQQQLSAMPEESLRPPRQIGDTKPSRALADFAGSYTHPGYGELFVEHVVGEEGEGRLYLHFRDVVAGMEHWHYDVFAARITEFAVGINLPLHFVSTADGFISAVEVPLEPMTGPIRFEYTAGPELYEVAYLQQFVGDFELMGIVLSIRVHEGQLFLDIPGQGSTPLEPERPNRFALHGAEGYTAAFDWENGTVNSLWLHQPNGSFEAEKVDEQLPKE